jgi:hypothetical protein
MWTLCWTFFNHCNGIHNDLIPRCVCCLTPKHYVAQFAIHLGCPIAKHYNESYKLWQMCNKFLVKLETGPNIVITKSQYNWKKVAVKIEVQWKAYAIFHPSNFIFHSSINKVHHISQMVNMMRHGLSLKNRLFDYISIGLLFVS